MPRPSGASPATEWTALLLQALDRLLQRLVIGAGLERFLPHAAGFFALAHHPQDFAEVRADLGVGPSAVGAAQLVRRAFQVAFSIQNPTQAVHDEVVIGCELK